MEQRLFEIRFPAKASHLCMIRALVKRAGEVVGCDEELCDKMVIAVNEACMNVIQHAYQEHEQGEIILEILNNDSQLLFRLKDFADPVDLATIKPRDLSDIRPGGLGTHFIDEIMDECERGHLEKGKGNYLKMVKKIT